MAQLKYTAEIELNEEQIQEILAKALEVGKDDVKIRKIFDERTKAVQLTAIFKKTFEILPDKSTVQSVNIPYIPTDSSTNYPYGLHPTWTSSDALDVSNFTSTK